MARMAGVLGGAWVVPGIASADGVLAVRAKPNERVTIASIGVGPQGSGLLRNALGLPDAQVIAVCDVNALRRDEAKRAVDAQYGNGDCATYRDFREVLGRDDIDAVIIATPDHWHVPLGVYAARAGKDMYIEKPLMLSLEQGRVLRDAIHRYGRVFQFGTQQRSSAEFRLACELVRNGYVGNLRTIKVGSPASVPSGNLRTDPVPDWIDYEMWQGPAPAAPFSLDRIENKFWWHHSAYALGFVAGWGIHHVDIAQWGNDSDSTDPIEAEGPGEFPPNGFRDCAVRWRTLMKYSNGVVLDYGDEGQIQHGIAFEGDEGWVYVKRGFIDAEPKSLLKTVFRPDDIRLYDSRNHMGNFVECVRTRAATVCPIDTAIRSDMICHLSDIAMRLGRKVRWDPGIERFVDDAEADRMLTRAMRAPWRV